jgi:hypothetical protein
MRAKYFFVAARLMMAIILLLPGSCAVLSMKGYEGQDLSADKTAVIEKGIYLYINKCDGVNLGFFQNKVIILPGDHTIEVSFQTQTMGDFVSYSNETASLTFKAEAGHTYVAHAHVVSAEGWIAYVVDKKTSERLAQSEILPVIQEWIINRLGW